MAAEDVLLMILKSKLGYTELDDGFGLWGGAQVRHNDAGEWFFVNGADNAYPVDVDILPSTLERYYALQEAVRNFAP